MEDVRHHDRGKRGSALVYPVVSRRAGGLSLGINLFPEGKVCSFDCPYCEVTPFQGEEPFSLSRLSSELEQFFLTKGKGAWAGLPVEDICLSGNGEPTLSPQLDSVLEACAEARRRWLSPAGSVPIRIITNSTGFLVPKLKAILGAFAAREGLEVWAKLDAGTEEWFSALSRSSYSLAAVVSGISDFAREVPVTIQTMVCTLAGKRPGPGEVAAYAEQLLSMLSSGAKIEEVQLYTVARRPLEAWVGPLQAAELSEYAEELRRNLLSRGKEGARLRVRCFDAWGKLPQATR